MYTFEISMTNMGNFWCYVKRREYSIYDDIDRVYDDIDRVIHAHLASTEQEAEAWVERRARFLNKTRYTVRKSFS